MSQLDDLIATGYFRRAGDIEGSIDPVTGEHVFRSASLGIEVRGKNQGHAERLLHDALRAHGNPHGAFAERFGKPGKS